MLLNKISVVDDKVNDVIALDAASREKINAMYKILVTGNGSPPLPELVRNNTNWINDQKKEIDERKKQGKQIFVMGIGQIFGLIVLAISVWIGLR